METPDPDQTFLVSRLTPVEQHAQSTHYLTVEVGDRAGERFEVVLAPILVGRAAGSAIQLADGSVSGRHCEFWLEGNRVRVRDLGSTNGTMVSGELIEGVTEVAVGATLQIGRTLFRHELRSPDELRKLSQLAELERASKYVQSLLPRPWTTGPVRADWCFVPSDLLGGDAFGYHRLSGEPERIAIYLLDVSGHGVAAALHSVSVLNLLQQGQMVGCDPSDPPQVLASLNRAFPMENHEGAYFTLWYGVYDVADRKLSFASAGHPPALLFRGSGSVERLQTRNLPIGMIPGADFQGSEIDVLAEEKLCLYSDGCFEVVTRDGVDWSLAEFEAHLCEARSKSDRSTAEPQLGAGSDLADTDRSGGARSDTDPSIAQESFVDSVRRSIEAVAENGSFGDDFSILEIGFE